VAARNELYGNLVNEEIFMRPGQQVTAGLTWFDNKAVDGTVTGTAAAVGAFSGALRGVQNGFARSYALVMFGGAVLLVAILVLVRL
jgi:NADH-quinone oxidoreductase subunit L